MLVHLTADLHGMQVRLDTARARAENILENQGAEGGGRAKAREINAIYAKAYAGKGASKSKPSRSAKMKVKGPRLDKRMLSDKRQVCISGFLCESMCESEQVISSGSIHVCISMHVRLRPRVCPASSRLSFDIQINARLAAIRPCCDMFLLPH